ncbi:MAG: hypothetical protein IKA57_01030 [Clostridia bacterium]|nr:hypothetical protein [Clostridia bacterium]
MARKKKNEVVEETVVAEPIEVAPAMPVEASVETPVEAPAEPKKWIVNCHRCGASVYVYVGDMVYMCPVCNNLFRVRKCEKLVKDITRNIVAEAYVNVHKGKDEE